MIHGTFLSTRATCIARRSRRPRRVQNEEQIIQGIVFNPHPCISSKASHETERLKVHFAVLVARHWELLDCLSYGRGVGITLEV